MKAVGIVAEFNPLHLGHNHILSRAKAMAGEDSGVICAMSSCFVQRGEPAVFTKYSRAEAAVRCGADLVIEIPCVWSLASAEGYARAGVELLDATGKVDRLLFGSECGDISVLSQVCDALLMPETDTLIGKELQSGISYAAARQKALEETLGEKARAVESPNNILGIEYIKAIKHFNSDIEPITFRRELDYSATSTRQKLCSGESVSEYISPEAFSIFSREMEQGRGPVTVEKLNDVFLSRLRLLSRDDCNSLPGAGDGLGDRLYKAINSQPDLKSVLDAVKTKRYAMSRVKRTVMCACLGIAADDLAQEPGYIRVLAMNGNGKELLHDMKKSARLPIITKPAHIHELGDSAKRIFDLERRAVDVCAMCFRESADRIPDTDFRINPVIF